MSFSFKNIARITKQATKEYVEKIKSETKNYTEVLRSISKEAKVTYKENIKEKDEEKVEEENKLNEKKEPEEVEIIGPKFETIKSYKYFDFSIIEKKFLNLEKHEDEESIFIKMDSFLMEKIKDKGYTIIFDAVKISKYTNEYEILLEDILQALYGTVIRTTEGFFIQHSDGQYKFEIIDILKDINFAKNFYNVAKIKEGENYYEFSEISKFGLNLINQAFDEIGLVLNDTTDKIILKKRETYKIYLIFKAFYNYNSENVIFYNNGTIFKAII